MSGEGRHARGIRVLKKNASTVSIENKLSISGFDEPRHQGRATRPKFGLIPENGDSFAG
jgi:hypothetical protein